ncbi:MAG: oligosaccharide flippase family protein [Thermoplasmata archaeon]|nr:oligosaccharide flippase family protein [Thermoplasmata archaeon]
MAQGSSEAREALGSVTRGTFLLLVATLGWVAFNFVARVLVVRELSTTQWGEFYYAISFTGLLAALGNLGIPQAVARSIPFVREDAERRGIIRAGFLLLVPAALVVGVFLVLTSGVFGRLFGGTMFGFALELFSVAVTTSIVASGIAAVFQGFEDVRANAYFIQLLNPVLFIVFLLGFGAAQGLLSFRTAVYAYVLSNVAMLVGLVAYYFYRIPRALPPGPAAHGVGSRLRSFALPLFAVSLLSYVANTGDTLFLGYFHPLAVGEYGVSIALSRLLLVGIGSLGYILLPVMVRFARSGDSDGAGLTYGTATKWMVLASLPPFLVFFFLPGLSLRFVYGSGYGVIVEPLRILCLGALFATLVGPATSAQVSYGETHALLYNTLIAAVVNVLLALWLIPPYGQTGAAIAWATATALVPFLSATQLALAHSVHAFQRHYLVPLLLTSVPLGLLYAMLPQTLPLWVLPVLVAGVAGVFLLAVLLSGSIDRGDRVLLGELERLLGRKVPGVRWLYAHFGTRRGAR